MTHPTSTPERGQYRKKPVVIEAYQFEGNIAWSEKPQWLLDAILAGKVWCQGGECPYLTIETLEGNHRADAGDWIIKGVKGELYPCKPEIFELTYEPGRAALASSPAVQGLESLPTYRPVWLQYGATMHRDVKPNEGGWLKRADVLAALAAPQTEPGAEQS